MADAVSTGTYYTAVAAYHDGSGILGAYGVFGSEEAAGLHGHELRELGVHPHEAWTVVPLRVIDLG